MPKPISPPCHSAPPCRGWWPCSPRCAQACRPRTDGCRNASPRSPRPRPSHHRGRSAIGLLQGLWRDASTLQGMEAALEIHRATGGPQRLHDGDVLLHQGVSVFLGQPDPLGRCLGLALSGYQVQRQAAAGKLVEGGAHLGQLHRADIAGPRGDQRLDTFGPGHRHGAADPGLPAGGGDGDEEILEAGRLGGLHHAVEQLCRGLDELAAVAIAGGVAGGRQEPSELSGACMAASPLRWRQGSAAGCRCQASPCRPLRRHRLALIHASRHAARRLTRADHGLAPAPGSEEDLARKTPGMAQPIHPELVPEGFVPATHGGPMRRNSAPSGQSRRWLRSRLAYACSTATAIPPARRMAAPRHPGRSRADPCGFGDARAGWPAAAPPDHRHPDRGLCRPRQGGLLAGGAGRGLAPRPQSLLDRGRDARRRQARGAGQRRDGGAGAAGLIASVIPGFCATDHHRR